MARLLNPLIALGFNQGFLAGFAFAKLSSIREQAFTGMFTSFQSLAQCISPVPLDRRVGIVHERGFELDTNNMEIGKRYLINYDGSSYEALKNPKGELELYEIG